ncbi:MAG: N-acetyltransferase [Solibacillus sp.]
MEEKRVVPTENGQELGEMTFVRSSGQFYIIDHARGRVVGQKLVETFVEQVRSEGRKIIRLCPFTKVQFDKNPDYADVLK